MASERTDLSGITAVASTQILCALGAAFAGSDSRTFLPTPFQPAADRSVLKECRPGDQECHRSVQEGWQRAPHPTVPVQSSPCVSLAWLCRTKYLDHRAPVPRLGPDAAYSPQADFAWQEIDRSCNRERRRIVALHDSPRDRACMLHRRDLLPQAVPS